MSPTKLEMIMITGLPHQPERCTTHSGGGEKENEKDRAVIAPCVRALKD